MKNDINRIYLDELREYLKSNLINLSSFAEQIGITPQGLHFILSSKRKKPYYKTLKSIAKALDKEKIGIIQGRIYFEKEEFIEENLSEKEKICLKLFRDSSDKRKNAIITCLKLDNED